MLNPPTGCFRRKRFPDEGCFRRKRQCTRGSPRRPSCGRPPHHCSSLLSSPRLSSPRPARATVTAIGYPSRLDKPRGPAGTEGDSQPTTSPEACFRRKQKPSPPCARHRAPLHRFAFRTLLARRSRSLRTARELEEARGVQTAANGLLMAPTDPSGEPDDRGAPARQGGLLSMLRLGSSPPSGTAPTSSPPPASNSG